MRKALKRKNDDKQVTVSHTKIVKYIDYNLVIKDIKMLETFYDFFDFEGTDVIYEFLKSKRFEELLVYFENFFSFNSSQQCLIFDVCKEILRRISSDFQDKYGLQLQTFCSEFVKDHLNSALDFLKAFRSVNEMKSCISFLTHVTVQHSEIALQVAEKLAFRFYNFAKLLNKRDITDEKDLRTCVIYLYASFYHVGNNNVIRKISENTIFLKLILKELYFDKFDNVELMLEILQDKIIRNNAISKTLKLKLFDTEALSYLMRVYDWKGEAISKDAYEKLHKSEHDSDCLIVYRDLHMFMNEVLCSTNGIVFTDYLLGQSDSHFRNKNLLTFITSSSFKSFLSHPLKLELVTAILMFSPDLIRCFVDHQFEHEAANLDEFCKFMIKIYQTFESKAIVFLNEAYSIGKWEKFFAVAMEFCVPTLQTVGAMIGFELTESLMELQTIFIQLTKVVLTWIDCYNSLSTEKERQQLKDRLKLLVIERVSKCSWEKSFEFLFSMKFDSAVQRTADIKPTTAAETAVEYMDEEMVHCFSQLSYENSMDPDMLKKCMDYFVKAPFSSRYLLSYVRNCFTKNITLHKKVRKSILKALIKKNAITQHWHTDGSEEREFIRNCIFDIIIAIVSRKKKLRFKLFESVHSFRLLSVYGGTLSHSDQKLFHLLNMSSNYCSVSIFGSAITEHYDMDAYKQPVMVRPMLRILKYHLIDERLLRNTIYEFPINRIAMHAVVNGIQLVSDRPTVYDPCFLLEWLLEMICDDKFPKLQLLSDVDLNTLYSKKILHFVVACLASHCSRIRTIAGMILQQLKPISVAIFSEKKLASITYHRSWMILSTLDHIFMTMSALSTPSKRLPSVIVNFYIRLLNLLSNPENPIYFTIWNMLINNGPMNIQYVPMFSIMMYADSVDSLDRRTWMLTLLSDSLRDKHDMIIMRQSDVLTNVFSIYSSLRPSEKRLVMTMLRRCFINGGDASLVRALYNYPGFCGWLLCQLTDGTYNTNDRSALSDICLRLVKVARDAGIGEPVDLDAMSLIAGSRS